MIEPQTSSCINSTDNQSHGYGFFFLRLCCTPVLIKLLNQVSSTSGPGYAFSNRLRTTEKCNRSLKSSISILASSSKDGISYFRARRRYGQRLKIRLKFLAVGCPFRSKTLVDIGDEVMNNKCITSCVMSRPRVLLKWGKGRSFGHFPSKGRGTINSFRSLERNLMLKATYGLTHISTIAVRVSPTFTMFRVYRRRRSRLNLEAWLSVAFSYASSSSISRIAV